VYFLVRRLNATIVHTKLVPCPGKRQGRLNVCPHRYWRGGQHGVRYPQWFLLLVAVLGILSGCRSSRDLERFARRHREDLNQALNQALGLNFKRWPSDATFLYLFNKAHPQEFGQVLEAWMVGQIPDGAGGLDQLVCDGKSLRGSAVVSRVNPLGRFATTKLAGEGI
jgi:hypothetical protein